MRSSEVVVVGGGVIGTSVAFHLAREGVEVTLLERDALAAGASGAAAGMLAPSGEADATGPFLTWAARGLAQLEALAPELLERSGVDCEWVRCGTLHLALDDVEARALEARARALDDDSLEWLDPASVRTAEPALTPALAGALWAPREAHVRSPLLARAYAAAARRLGARIETGVEVQALRVEGGRTTGLATTGGPWATPRVVLCTGAFAGTSAAWLDTRPHPPVTPVRGQILSLEAPSPACARMIRGGGGYLVPKRDGSVVVGATEEQAGFDVRTTADGLQRLLELGMRLVPGLGDASFGSAWAGLRPGSPDGLPLIGPVADVAGLALATGHHRNGVLLSAVTGRLVADWVAGKGIPEDAAAFLPSRFDPSEA